MTTDNLIVRDADEIQALIRHHAIVISMAIDDGGIKPSRQDELERTCARMLELSKALAGCPIEARTWSISDGRP
jgi:hypothetical protein